MDGKPTTFWEHIYDLRKRGKIPRVWRATDLRTFLEGVFSANTIKVYPSNCSISMEGHGIGDYVKNGQVPKMWRMGRGQFQLVADPEDDETTRQADRHHASKRAKELRLMKTRANGSQDETPTQLAPPDQPSPQIVSSPGSPDLYPSIPITITSEARQALADLNTAEKAVHIVRGYFLVKYGDQAKIEEDHDGADLRVSLDGKTLRIEVKGTTESDSIAWSKLKVSSQKSHDSLKSGDALMYRVVDVNGPNPRIYVLEYGRHFTLEPEPRWAVKRVPSKDDRYPLRGEPYRYELPYDPVAADEWEVQK